MIELLSDIARSAPLFYTMMVIAIMNGLAIPFFISERRKFRSWLAEENPGCGTVVLAKLGLLVSWSYLALAAVATVGAIFNYRLLVTLGREGTRDYWLGLFPWLKTIIL